MLDFSKADARRRLNSKKWTRFAEDVIPMPVADMDCAVAPAIQAALESRVKHGVFGYDHPPANALDVFIAHCATHYTWDVEADWIVPVAGVVPAQFAAVAAFAKKAGDIAIPNPIYHSFPRAPTRFDCEPRAVLSAVENQREVLDSQDFEAIINHAKHAGLSLLCNPHNPGGAVYTEAELRELADASEAADSVMVSDEIWADLILDDQPHVPMAKVSPSHGVSILAATKTWNIAGLPLAFVVIPNERLRAKFKRAVAGYPEVTPLAWHATTAAYGESEAWRQAVLAHLRVQRAQIADFADQVGWPMHQLQGTYLAWLDASATPDAHARCVTAGVGPDDGAVYGRPGFLRFNLACSTEALEAAIQRLLSAFG